MFQNPYGNHKNRHQNWIGNVSSFASCQVWEAGSGHCGESSKRPRKFRVGTRNANTLRGRVCEVVETQSHRKVDVCCIEETLCPGSNRSTIKGKDTRYKVCWSRNGKGTDGLGVFVAEEWIGKVSEAQRVPDRIILVKLIVGQHVDTILCVNAPQSGLVMRLKTCSWISWVLWLPGSQDSNFSSYEEIGMAM